MKPTDIQITDSESLTNGLRDDPWQQLRQFTRARIALGRVGSSLPTREILDFGMSHAMARDAVHLPLDTNLLIQQIEALGLATLQVRSQAGDRHTYLLRPDLGRTLADVDVASLQATSTNEVDLLLVVGDGLSSMAVARHAVPLIAEIQQAMPQDWTLGPVVVASQARVAIADEIGALLKARMVAMLIGERPGLSSPDSLGIYLTYAPEAGRSDADRNCISNVRPEGLPYPLAARKLLWLAREAMHRKVSGVALKDESDAQELDVTSAPALK